MTNAVAVAQSGSSNPVFRNKIINGAMTIDQRNSGASLSSSTNGVYTLDRWSIQNNSGGTLFAVQQNGGSVTPPSGFKNYLAITTSTTFTPSASQAVALRQIIEGLNTYDLAWGTADAKTVTLSFWVRSSATGTFSGSFLNNSANRSYCYTYTINAANTWEYKTITVAGDTGGSWATDNGAGIQLHWNLSTGSSFVGSANTWSGGFYFGATGSVNFCANSGATFYITGVQLEAGSTASPFENRLYGTELQLCQRYYQRIQLGDPGGSACGLATGVVNTSTQALFPFVFPVPMRSGPSLVTTGTVSNYQILAGNNTSYTCTNINFGNASTSAMIVNGYVASGLTASNAAMLRDTTGSAAGFIAFNAEL